MTRPVFPISAAPLGLARARPLLTYASIQVQACLGILWGEKEKKFYKNGGRSDVDIFCSAKAAPAVRSVSDHV